MTVSARDVESEKLGKIPFKVLFSCLEETNKKEAGHTVRDYKKEAVWSESGALLGFVSKKSNAEWMVVAGKQWKDIERIFGRKWEERHGRTCTMAD